MIYRATGNLRAIQTLLGHTNIGNTVRYLGVDIWGALELAEQTEICQRRLASRRKQPTWQKIDEAAKRPISAVQVRPLLSISRHPSS